MTRYFTQYWRNETWDLNRHDGHHGSPLEHTADNSFRAAGVSRGDHIYIVTIRGGKLFLLCRGLVARITDQRDAAKHLGTQPEMLWNARDHLLFKKDAPALQDFDRTVPGHLLERIEALRAGGTQKLKLRAGDKPDQQALRGLVELTPETAKLFDRVIAEDHDEQAPASRRTRENAGPAAILAGHGRTRRTRSSLTTERQFEIQTIEPLIKGWGCEHERQHRHHYKRGSQTSYLLIDHLVSDAEGPLTLFENKRRLNNAEAVTEAMRQARSYAKELDLPSFVVAAPDGLWLYGLWQGKQDLQHPRVPIPELSIHEAELLKRLRLLRKVYGSAQAPVIDFGDLQSSPGDGAVSGGRALRIDPPPAGLEIHQPEASAYLDVIVLHVVRVVGPIPQADLIREVRSAWGLARAGRLVREAIEASIARQMRQKKIGRSRDKKKVVGLA